MKKDTETWSEYLGGYLELLENSEKRVIIDFELKKLEDFYNKYLDYYYGNLMDKDVEKAIRKVKNPIFLIKQYGEYSFVFQCLTTGRYSKKIKEQLYDKFSIDKNNHELYLERDKNNNGVLDKIKPYSDEYYAKLRRLFDTHKMTYTPYREKYQEYLMSDEWKYVKRRTLHIHGYKCVISGQTENLDIHHLTYENVGCEKINDTIPLARHIHEEYHLLKSKKISNFLTNKIESFKN
jgi:hypothetical protein